MDQVVIEKLTKNVTEAHLREIFGTYGSIQDLDMPVNRQCMPASFQRSRDAHPADIRSSHDQSRYCLHRLSYIVRCGDGHCAHARSPARWRVDQRLHRPPPTQVLPLANAGTTTWSGLRPRRTASCTFSGGLPRTTATTATASKRRWVWSRSISLAIVST